MKKITIYLLSIILLISFSCKSKHESPRLNAAASDSIYTSLLINHLRNNFDDIHDVSMRFHHFDHNLNGVIEIAMHWENGSMTSSSVVTNETKNDEFAKALIKNIEKWHIKDLTGPFDIVLPLRIQIVGSDDPTFFEKGILTGEITDSDNKPIKAAKIAFRSSINQADSVRSCYSSREGIFVRTLIPVGSWDIECTAPGFQKVHLHNVIFSEGAHLRKKITMMQLD